MVEQLYTGTAEDFVLFERADAVIRDASALFVEAKNWFEREWRPRPRPSTQAKDEAYGEIVVAQLRDKKLRDLANRFVEDRDEPEADRRAIAAASLSDVRAKTKARRILARFVERHALYPLPAESRTTGKTPLASILPCTGSLLEQQLDLTALPRAKRELLALRIAYVTWLLWPDAHENEELWPYWWRSTCHEWESARHISLARHNAMHDAWAALASVAIRICERMIDRGATRPKWDEPGGRIQNAELAAHADLSAERVSKDLTEALEKAGVARPISRRGQRLIWKYEHLSAAYSHLRPAGKLKKLLTRAGFDAGPKSAQPALGR